MFRYNYYYGHWSSDSDSDGGGDYNYRPNVGEGGKDTGYAPAPPTPPVVPPAPTSTLQSMTPAIMTLNEIDEYNGSNAGYIPAGQFTEARGFPLSCCKATSAAGTRMVICKNERTNYNYSAMSDETFRFPYYVPAGANLSTLAPPEISFCLFTRAPAGQSLSGSFTIEAVSPTTDGTYTWAYNTPAGVGTNNHVSGFGGITTHVLNTTQMLNFVPGKFNDFLFKIKMTNPQHLTLGTNQGFQFVIWDIKTSVPDGYSFELKLQSNWESYFNINVVNKNNRNLKGTSTGNQSVTLTPYTPGAWQWNITAPWTWKEYDVAAGYTHWEIPVNTFSGNKTYDLPITVFPENDDFCSMEPGLKLPGPKAPWNLLSRHESFWYAPTTMRITDYAQNIPNAVFYCPRNWRGVVWLKPGVANNDIL